MDRLCAATRFEMGSPGQQTSICRRQSLPELANQDDVKFTLRWGMARHAERCWRIAMLAAVRNFDRRIYYGPFVKVVFMNHTSVSPRISRSFGVNLVSVSQSCLQAGLGLLFPPACASCESALDTDQIYPALCADCIGHICVSSRETCPRCGAFGTKLLADREGCLECRAKDLSFDQVVSLGIYEGRLRDAVVKMKSVGGESIATALGTELAKQIDCPIQDAQSLRITCVPKYGAKRLFTGVNSAESIMCGIGRYLPARVSADLLKCRRRLRKQSLLSPQQRRANVRNAFVVSTKFDVSNARVILVDDIMTTGATAHEAAKALKKVGAARVDVAVVGRAKLIQ